MNKLISLLTIFALVAVAVPVFANPGASNTQRVIVAFNHAVNEDARQALENEGGQILGDLGLINGLVVSIPKQARDRIASLSGVSYVENDVKINWLSHHRDGHGGGPPGDGGGDDDDDGSSDPEHPVQEMDWGVDRIDADLAWSSATGSGVDVAVIDTGIDLGHADLSVVRGVDCTRGPNCDKAGDGNDDNGHGTHVAGTVAALNNDIGVVGVAPDARLNAVKVLDSNGSGFLSDVIEGIDWATDNNMDVINMSLGTSSHYQSLQDAVDAADAAGVVVVAAAGNSGDGDPNTNDVGYPAKYSSVIAVAATDSSDGSPSWSSEGAEVEVAAPGANVRSTWNDGLYYTASGTSMASPHAAGTVALMLSAGVSSADVRATLSTTADDLGTAGFDNHYGHGLVDAEEATTGTETN